MLPAQSISSVPQPAGEGGTKLNTVSLAVYPLVSTGMPAAGSAGTIDSSQVQQDIKAGISASQYGPFEEKDMAAAPGGFDPGVPPTASDSDGDGLTDIQGCTYSLTSQEFYDSENQQTQGQVWLYDNTTQTLVATDQFVFPIFQSTDPPATDARAVSASLVDYILSLIPTYTVQVSTTKGGTVATRNGEAIARSPHWHGSGIMTLRAQPELGWYFQGWRINNKQTLDTANPLHLVLNTLNYPGKTSRADPWGTKVTVSVQAVFTDDINQAAERNGSMNRNVNRGGRNGKTGPQRMYFALGWQPELVMAGRLHNDYTGSAFVPVGFDLSAGFCPWVLNIGSLGCEAKVNWSRLNIKNAINNKSNKGNLMSFSLNVLLNIPMGSHFEIPLSLGGGFGLFSNLSTAAGQGQYGNNFLLDASTGLRWLPWGEKGLFLALNVDFECMIENSGLFAFSTAPVLNLGWKF
jgi:hypothetical protein